MIDLTNETWRSNRFGGSEKKRTLIYEGKTYMVKFPDPVRSTKRTMLSYINNQFSVSRNPGAGDISGNVYRPHEQKRESCCCL